MHRENVSYAGILWHVAYVEPRFEARVTRDVVDELGFEAYAPMERHWAMKRGKRVQVARPLFPRYLFVGVDPYRQGWQALLDVDGVVDVLGRPALDEPDRLPSHVPPSWIAAIRKAEQCGVFDRTKAMPDNFKIGEKIRVSDGPFTGYFAIIQHFIAKLRCTTQRKRARVLVQFMGRMSAVEMDLTQLEKL